MVEKIKLTQNRWVGKGELPFVIAEIGNNHNGNIRLAKRLIQVAKELDVDAVKFQKKDIETAFSRELLNGPYDGSNSFGDTYREHKEYLELSGEQFEELKRFCEI